MARCFALGLALLMAVAVTSAFADSSADGPLPSVLTPIATSPLPSDAADGPDMMDDSDVGGVGAPLGTHQTEPEADPAAHADQTADQGSAGHASAGHASAAGTVTSSVAAIAAISAVAASCFVF